jgi:hypothetical protein
MHSTLPGVPALRARCGRLIALAAAALAVCLPARAGTAVRMEVPDLVQHADLVLEGRVVGARAVTGPEGRIDTEYTLSVARTFWGEHQPVRTLRLPGGELPNGRGLVVAGMPHLVVGEDALLFLSPEARGMRMPTGLAQGKLRIVSDVEGHRVLVREQADLSLIDARSGAVRPDAGAGPLDYDDVVVRIEAAVVLKRTLREKAAARGGEGR